MILEMSEGEEGVQELPTDDDLLETGLMGDCGSVIVLWDRDNDQHPPKYTRVRGQHGGGGVDAIGFDALFEGVPDETETMIIAVGQTMTGNERFLEKVQEHIGARYSNAVVKVVRGCANLRVDRYGTTTRVD